VTSAPPTSISTTAVIAAPPTLVDVSVPALSEPTPAGPGSGSSHKSGWGKKVKPPSMVLDDDVNGFRGNPKRKGGGGKKNKKVRIITFLHEVHATNFIKNKNIQQLVVWDPSEPYDPSRPNDYNEYKVWKHRDHEERIERIAKERRMEAQKRLRRSSSRSDYTESDPEDIRPRKTGTELWESISFDDPHKFSTKDDTELMMIVGLAKMVNIHKAELATRLSPGQPLKS